MSIKKCHNDINDIQASEIMGKIEELFLKVQNLKTNSRRGTYDFVNHNNVMINTHGGQVRTILLSNIPSKFISIRSPLLAFENALIRSEMKILMFSILVVLIKFMAIRYAVDFKNQLKTIIPKIKTEASAETDLIKLMNVHEESAFDFQKSLTFLTQRHWEIFAISLVLRQIGASPDIIVTDGLDGMDTNCVFSNEWATVFALNILPNDNVTTKFLRNAGKDEEGPSNAKWFYDNSLLGGAGEALRNFVNFASVNRCGNVGDDDRCK